MAIFNRFKRRSKRRVFVLGLDGVPYSMVCDLIAKGHWPNFANLFGKNSFVRMHSVIPTISSVAWSSFMTGKNPAKHNIFGFVDRVPNPFQIYIPTGKNMKTETLWEILSKNGKRVVVMNVPVTYPPREVNGILVSGFLATDIDKAIYPKEISSILKDMGYIIDVDPWKAKEEKDQFLEDLFNALERRFEVMFHFLKREQWDFFMCHIMETDRINHFFWDDWEKGGKYSQKFVEFYKKIDSLIGELWQQLEIEKPTAPKFIVLSDHGFCSIKQEVHINHWLVQKGWLKFKKTPPKDFTDIDSTSKAYSLIPGRIFINLKGREEMGTVNPDGEYDKLRSEIKAELSELKDPDTGEAVVKMVYNREDIYSGPFFNSAADLIVLPNAGYDLKGKLYTPRLFDRSHIVGMHTYDDAFLAMVDEDFSQGKSFYRIYDVMPSILAFMGIPAASDLDGDNILISL
ncbi:MAG: alkaline phosphatase family protein [Candidatus Marinimicrobia bacterium]|nr:alkaline phosphatase family protein [Candidatus Neomarinimicrobiota bacterium]